MSLMIKHIYVDLYDKYYRKDLILRYVPLERKIEMQYLIVLKQYVKELKSSMNAKLILLILVVINL
jgi:hypothetical protein